MRIYCFGGGGFALLAILGGCGCVDSFHRPLDPRGRRRLASNPSLTYPMTFVRMRPPSSGAKAWRNDDAEMPPSSMTTATNRRDALRRFRNALISSTSSGVAATLAWHVSSDAARAAAANEDGPPGSQTPQKLKSSAVGAEIFLSGLSIYAMLFVISGRSFPKNDDYSATKARVVMIQPEPYGLDAGRRYYNGVNVRTNDPIPPSDRVRSSCEKGVVDDGCAAAITDFLGEVREISDKGGVGPSDDQRETANAVLTYLDSLSSSSSSSSLSRRPPVHDVGGGGSPPPDDAPVTVAFASYLDGLSRGEIDAPSSTRVVAEYLSSLNEVRGRMVALESSVGRLPDEISSRLENWQRERDEQLAREFVKIEELLIKNVSDGRGGGGMEDRVPSVDMNGNYVPVNGSYGSRGSS
ncbi:hypothetical protein ACHAXA_003387 [Cyclostephanos tholiformis]|uniref:Diatom pyrenoid component 2 domain-containing protein n=1 Tax=Cyclostephanos tholiformis TaxID=382380 RepID=A0ABD3R538_9STRA